MISPTSLSLNSKKIIIIEIIPEFSSSVINHLMAQKIPFHLRFDVLEPDGLEKSDVSLNLNEDSPSIKQGGYALKNEQGKIEWMSPLKKEPENLTEYYKKKWPKMVKIYEKYIGDGSKTPPSVEEIAKEMGIYTATFKNQFKRIYGESFYKVYMSKRMEYAAKLLRKGYTASLTAYEVGYMHPIKFNKQFQKYFGITPYQYKMKHFHKLETIS